MGDAIIFVLWIWCILFLILMLVLSVINIFLVKKSIKNNSLYYLNVLKLNEKYKDFFIKVNSDFYYKCECNSLQVYRNRCSLDSVMNYMCDIIESDLETWKKLAFSIEKNIFNYNMYEGFLKELNTNFKGVSYENVRRKVYFLSKSSYVEIESQAVHSIKINPIINLKIIVRVFYISPAGRNYYAKDYLIDFNGLNEIFERISEKNLYKESIKYQRALMTNSKRYDILKRDGFRCQICGRTQLDGAKLEVDHIIPVSKGGKTVMSNLQTLCDRCNIGKSNKVDESFLDNMICPECGSALVIRKGKFGKFIGCSNYPSCHYTK